MGLLLPSEKLPVRLVKFPARFDLSDNAFCHIAQLVKNRSERTTRWFILQRNGFKEAEMTGLYCRCMFLHTKQTVAKYFITNQDTNILLVIIFTSGTCALNYLKYFRFPN
jgi:hypothetical protein